MSRTFHTLAARLLLALPLLFASALEAEAQGRGNRGRGAAPAAVTLSVEVTAQIREFYASRPVSGAEALPPGIRRRLERGKPPPPGIAKKTAPPELHSLLELPGGYEIVEVGLDVFFVEVATGIIHDALLDLIR